MNLDEQYEFFLKNHYCLFPSALSKAELDSVNKAIDGIVAQDPKYWASARAQTSQVSDPAFDCLLRHPSFSPLATKIFEGDIALIEFGMMIRQGNQTPPAEPAGWHQDFGISEHDPLGITALSAIMYTYDVDATTARYTLVPNSHRLPARPKQVAPGRDEIEGEVEIVGPAGTIVLVNAGIFHTGKLGAGPRERRTIHLYMQRTSFPSVSNHTVMPRRLWDVADPEQRRYYSHFNAVTKAAIEAETKS